MKGFVSASRNAEAVASAKRNEDTINGPFSEKKTDPQDDWDIVNDNDDGQIEIGPPGSWNSLEDQLDQQKRGESLVATHLAKLDCLIHPSAVHVLAAVEATMFRRMNLRRVAALRARRRQRTILLDTKEALRSLLDRIVRLDHSKPQVVIDCEGFDFSKIRPSIDIMELFVRPLDKLYLLDVAALGGSSWSTTATNSDFCLKKFLSSDSHKKIMWDLRMDAHVLNNGYDIRLSGVIDSSLWALAYCRNRTFAFGDYRMSILRACKEFSSSKIERAELMCMEDAKSARHGLGPRSWAIRPLPSCLIDYAADVKYMGLVYDSSRRLLEKRYMSSISEIERFTEQELEIACDPFYEATREKEAISPWTPGYIEGAKDYLRWKREVTETKVAERAATEALLHRDLHSLHLDAVYVDSNSEDDSEIVDGDYSSSSE